MPGLDSALLAVTARGPPLVRLLETINTSRKATVAYPTIKRPLFHMFFLMNFQKLLESH